MGAHRTEPKYKWGREGKKKGIYAPVGHAFHTSSLTRAIVVSGSNDMVLRRPETRRKVREVCGVCGTASGPDSGSGLGVVVVAVVVSVVVVDADVARAGGAGVIGGAGAIGVSDSQGWGLANWWSCGS